MGFRSLIKGVIDKMFAEDAEKIFGTDIAANTLMDYKITDWLHTYQGRPEWVSHDERIRSVKFAKTICSETARLATLSLGIEFDGGVRAEWMQKMYDEAVGPRLRNWVEFGCAAGTVILKPTSKGVDLFLPGQFHAIKANGRMLNDVIFQNRHSEGKGNSKKYYTKLERHNFMFGKVKGLNDSGYKDVVYYHIENKVFLSSSEKSLGREIDLKDTIWKELQPDAYITKVNGTIINTMLFGVFKMPMANDIDMNSPLGVAIFSDAMEELKDLDIAYSRNATEIYDSETIELLDDRLISLAGKKIGSDKEIKLPHHVKNVMGSDSSEFYQSIERKLHTEERIKGINNQLSMIGYKCGYSNGYFVFDQKTGMVTATQVEADDRRTIQLIKDIRDALRVCLDDLFYAMSVFADIYALSPVEPYEAFYDFGDITYNWEEDRARHWQYVQAGKYPLWRYYVKFEGMSEEEAKNVVSEAQGENKEPGLFGNEE